MSYWLMVMVLHISGPAGEVRDPSAQIVDGFSSQARCEAGARKVAESLIGSIGRARMGQGIQGESYKQIPKIQYQCVEVQK